jgi:hypothetical protein
MKKFASILFSVLFSIFILVIEAGIIVVKCNHSGNYKVTLASVELENDFKCNPAHNCMQEDFYKFSPDVTFDFHNLVSEVLSSVVFNINFFVFDSSVTYKFVYNTTFNDNPPPRDYYKIFRVFRI